MKTFKTIIKDILNRLDKKKVKALSIGINELHKSKKQKRKVGISNAANLQTELSKQDKNERDLIKLIKINYLNRIIIQAIYNSGIYPAIELDDRSENIYIRKNDAQVFFKSLKEAIDSQNFKDENGNKIFYSQIINGDFDFFNSEVKKDYENSDHSIKIKRYSAVAAFYFDKILTANIESDYLEYLKENNKNKFIETIIEKFPELYEKEYAHTEEEIIRRLKKRLFEYNGEEVLSNNSFFDRNIDLGEIRILGKDINKIQIGSNSNSIVTYFEGGGWCYLSKYTADEKAELLKQIKVWLDKTIYYDFHEVQRGRLFKYLTENEYLKLENDKPYFNGEPSHKILYNPINKTQLIIQTSFGTSFIIDEIGEKDYHQLMLNLYDTLNKIEGRKD